MKPPSPLGAAAALTAFALAAPVQAAPRPATFVFDQPAQPLARALLALSERTGAVVLAPAPLVASRAAPALKGALSLHAALETLLAGSPLDFTIGADSVVTIIPAAPRPIATRRLAEPTTQTPPPKTEESAAEIATVRVTAARNLDPPTALKRRTPSPVDILTEEQIARSGASGLGDAMRQLTGAAAVSDGGETRQIALRGVASRFTRVRINGMETLATFGGANVGGGTNRGRAFDYNVFAADLFKQIRLQKTASADIDEGSLGATVDIRTRSPFDLPDRSLSLYVEQAWNSRAERLAPRGSIVLSRRLADDRLGVLVSAAYSRRYAVDVGSTAGGWQSGDALSPGFGAVTGGASLAEVNAALHARIPRLELMTADQKRLGLTGALDWRPTDRTRVSLDLLYATLRAQRNEFLLESFTFRTAGACAVPNAAACGLNGVTAVDPVITTPRPGLPVLIAGTFDGVDVKSEARHDELETIFRQATLTATHKLGNNVEATLLAGFSRSDFSNPVQETLHLDQYGVNGFAYDFRDAAHPSVGYGDAILTQAAPWTLSEVRDDPNWVDNSFRTAGLDLRGSAQGLDWQAGVLHKAYRTEAKAFSRSNGTIANVNDDIPAAFAAISVADYVRMVGADAPFGTVAPPTQWLAPDVVRGFALLRAACERSRCDAFQLGLDPIAGVNYAIGERDDAAYIQVSRPRRTGRKLWGDAGLRLARTAQDSSGPEVTADGTLKWVRVQRRYDDVLPSANLVWEPTGDLVFRFGAARVMARPDLRSLRPGYTVSTTSLKVISAGAPDLKPTRATTFDAALEWYARWGAALSLAAYHKSIDSTVHQTITAPAAFATNPYGLPSSVATLACGGAAGCDPALPIWQFIRPANTGPGQLNGLELSGLSPLGPPGSALSRWKLQGAVGYSRSRVRYRTQGGDFQTVADALGGPRMTANLSLAYQVRGFDARAGLNHRGRYVTAIPSSTGGDLEGVDAITTIDASARWRLSPAATLSLDAANLTNAQDRQYVDSSQIASYQHRTGRDVRLGLRLRFR